MVIKVIEWYESNREKVKEAEDALKDFELQDNIDDLNAAKDAELEALNERIRNWDDYLSMLESRYEEFDRLQQQKLLMELLGATSEEEVQAMIQSDMLAFTEYMSTHTNEFFNDQISAFAAFNTTFAEFLEEYKENLEELYNFKTEDVNIISADDWLPENDEYPDTNPVESTSTQEKKKANLDQSLYEIIINDTRLLQEAARAAGYDQSGGIGKVSVEDLAKYAESAGIVVDSNGKLDYSAAAKKAYAAGDYTTGNYLMAIRQVKYEGDAEHGYAGMDPTEYYKTNKQWLEEWVKEGVIKDTDRITGSINSNIKTLVNLINETNTATYEETGSIENLIQLEGQDSQFTLSLLSSISTDLTEGQVQSLFAISQGTDLLTNGINGMSIDLAEAFSTDSETLAEKFSTDVETINSKIGDFKNELIKELRDLLGVEEEEAIEIVNEAAADYGRTGGSSGEGRTYELEVPTASGGSASILVTEDASGNRTSVTNTGGTGTYYVGSAKGQEFLKGTGEATMTGGDGSVWVRDASGVVTITNAAGDKFTGNAIQKYAGGLDEGPVTYTGLAMLHGSPSKPEFVLNNDQAYNLLRYMSTSKPEFESNLSGTGDTVYDFGGVVINEVNSAEEFFCELNKAMSSRYNITKNRK